MGAIHNILVIISDTLLMTWDTGTNNIYDTQGGFKKGKGTEEFIFSLDMLLRTELRNGREYMTMVQLDTGKA